MKVTAVASDLADLADLSVRHEFRRSGGRVNTYYRDITHDYMTGVLYASTHFFL